MDRQRIAHAKAAHVDRPRHLPPDLVPIFLELDVPRAELFSAAAQLVQVLVVEVFHPVYRILAAGLSPPLPPPISQTPPASHVRNLRKPCAAAIRNTGTTSARWC